MFKIIGIMAHMENGAVTKVGFKISPKMTMHARRSARIGHNAEDMRNMTIFTTTNFLSTCSLLDGKKLSKILDATLIASR